MEDLPLLLLQKEEEFCRFEQHADVNLLSLTEAIKALLQKIVVQFDMNESGRMQRAALHSVVDRLSLLPQHSK